MPSKRSRSATIPARVVSPVYQEIQRHEHAPRIRPLPAVDRHASSSTTSRRWSAWRIDPDRPDESGARRRCRRPLSCAGRKPGRDVHGRTRQRRAGRRRSAGDRLGRGRAGARAGSSSWPIAPSTLALAEAGRYATRSAGPRGDPARRRFTHRLRYRWRWTSSSGLDPVDRVTALDVQQLERAG